MTIAEELQVDLQKLLADVIHDMVEQVEQEPEDTDRIRLTRALSDGAERLLIMLPALLQDFQHLFEQSFDQSPDERHARWRGELHRVMISAITDVTVNITTAVNSATLVDTLAEKALTLANEEHKLLTQELAVLRLRTASLERLLGEASSSKTVWFTEGADFTKCPGNVLPTVAQIWGELLSYDPDERLEELAKLLDFEGRTLR